VATKTNVTTLYTQTVFSVKI